MAKESDPMEAVRLLQSTPLQVETAPATSNPATVGMYGLGLTLTLQMLPYTGLTDEPAKNLMYGFALFFGGLGQLVCAAMEYSRKNTFATVTWLCFSGYWLGTGLIGILEAADVLEPSAKGTAAASALWGVLSFLLWTQTFKTNLALNQLLLWVAILLWLEAACPTHPGLYRATGVFGIVTAGLAFYIGTAVMCIEMYGKELLPVGTFNWGTLPGKRRLGPVATRKELLQLNDLEGALPAAAAHGAAHGAHELSV